MAEDVETSKEIAFVSEPTSPPPPPRAEDEGDAWGKWGRGAGDLGPEKVLSAVTLH